MPKAEIGSTKHLAKQMKAKGLQRLRWYCQICGKQCRDENGFKQHTMSEGHVRAMLLVGEDPKKFIREYSRQFQRDFLQLLRTSHGEKKVHMNNFYQEYIRDKEHIHMNATQWPSLTEFAKHLGREGICRVEEGERGLEISWIDDSAEAIKRREDIKKMDARAKGDEELESKLLEQQIRRAREAQQERDREAETDEKKSFSVESAEPVKVSLSLKSKISTNPTAELQKDLQESGPVPIESFSKQDSQRNESIVQQTGEAKIDDLDKPEASPVKVSLSLKPKTMNPLAKKNVFAKEKAKFASEPEKKMSNAERIMKEEIERKRLVDQRGYGGGGKRQRLG